MAMTHRMFYDNNLSTIEDAYTKAIRKFREIGTVDNEILLENIDVSIGSLIGQCISMFKKLANKKKEFQVLIANNESMVDKEKIKVALEGFDISTNNLSALIESLKDISTDLGYKKAEAEKEAQEEVERAEAEEKIDELGEVEEPAEEDQTEETKED